MLDSEASKEELSFREHVTYWAYLAEGYKVRPEKTQSDLKSWFSPEMALVKSQKNFQTRLKTRLKSNFLVTLVSNIYFKKLTIGRLSLICIYWYYSTKRFMNSHLFMHSRKGGLTIDLMIEPPWWECVNKLGNYK